MNHVALAGQRVAADAGSLTRLDLEALHLRLHRHITSAGNYVPPVDLLADSPCCDQVVRSACVVEQRRDLEWMQDERGATAATLAGVLPFGELDRRVRLRSCASGSDH